MINATAASATTTMINAGAAVKEIRDLVAMTTMMEGEENRGLVATMMTSATNGKKETAVSARDIERERQKGVIEREREREDSKTHERRERWERERARDRSLEARGW